MEHHLESTKSRKLPLIYPIILYNGAKPYRHSMDLFDLFSVAEKELAKKIFISPYHLIDLTQVSDDELKQYLWFGTMALTLKHIHDSDILSFVKEILHSLKELEKRGEERYIYSIIAYMAERGETSRQGDLIEAVKELESIEEEKLMTLLEYLKPAVIKRNFEKGFAEGIEKGREEEKIEIAKILLLQGVDIKTIVKATTLSDQDIKKLLS